MTVGNPASATAALQIGTRADAGSAWHPDAGKLRQPLTHHEILRLIEPFTRRGRHVDLAASDRLERRLVFKPVVLDSDMPCGGASEVLQLENFQHEVFRLTRTLTLRGGAIATLQIDGAHPRDLLARIDVVSPQRQFQVVGNYVVALNYRLEPSAIKPSDDSSPPLLVLISAKAQLDGLTLHVKAETGKGYPAEIALTPEPDRLLELPDDVLATLGWDWKVLRRRGAGWTGTLRVPRREPDRSRRIEAMLEQTVAHLAQILNEPPRRFHERLVRARWRVFFRRTLPLLACLALIAGAGALTLADIPQDSMLLMMIFNFPPLLMLILFGMRELPRFEIPPVPRPSTSPSWLPPGGRPN